MKIFKLDKSPLIYSWSKEEDTEGIAFDFGEMYSSLERVSLVPDAVFYWYKTGSYEGDGDLIAVKDGKWYYKSLSHCSCYGPLEDFATDILEYRYSSLDELKQNGTDEWRKGVKPLVELAKKEGYK